ncbi:MAG: HAD hydrolase-like protein [Parcubacteria group bacterium]|nr:HAD hydrolase-like protein [Parcubacteria group bacterium]
MVSVKCIIFDADGVVINSHKIFSEQYQKKYNISYDKMLAFFDTIFQDCLVGRADLKEAIKPYLKDWKWDGSVDELLEFWFSAEDKPNLKMINFIEKLREKGIKCYLMTSQEKYRTEYMKKEMNFDNIFDKVFSSAYIGYKKPDLKLYEAVYNEINKEIKVNKDEILFFDDGEKEVEGAMNFGIKAYLYEDFDEFVNILSNNYKIII